MPIQLFNNSSAELELEITMLVYETGFFSELGLTAVAVGVYASSVSSRARQPTWILDLRDMWMSPVFVLPPSTEDKQHT